jgi:hypothetical protein
MGLELILGILKEGLKLANSKEATKYLDQVVKIEKSYYEELSKSEADRSQLYLDERLLELETIASNFIKFANKKQ